MSSFTPSAEVCAAGKGTVGGLFRSVVAANANRIALVDGDRSLTYEQLEDRTNRLANVFTDRGLSRGDRVAILAHNRQEFLEVELAAAKSGIIVAALNWRLGDRELAHCINLVEPKLLILEAAFSATATRLDIGTLPKIFLGEEYEQALAFASNLQLTTAPDPEDGLVILYTSGTTGLPKGALISHRAMIARGMCFATEQAVPPGDNFIAWAPLYHMASTDQSLAILMRGGTVYTIDGYDPDHIIDLVENIPMRFLVLIPGMVGDFANRFRDRRAVAKSVGICGAMADLVPREEIAAATTALNAPYLNTFGATETGLPPATGATIPIGIAPTSLSKRQSSFCEIRLVDPDDNEVPVGTPGEVAIRGPTLFSGYWNAHETNAHEFRNGWFHMGDVMRRNVDGTLDYVDRVKYMIKSGGENIYPAEIEQVVLEDERVSEAVVVRKSDPKWGEVPVVFVVIRDKGVAESDILNRCRENLSSYKRPKQVIFMLEADLPRSTTGKIQRHELEARL
ncbi:MAG: AMP-binding protein [Pseudomonadota bacterium]